MAKDIPGRTIVKEIKYPIYATESYLEKILDTLPRIIKGDDPLNPEWVSTPIYEIDLSPLGIDMSIYVKDESDKKSNPTGTFKDRRAHENGPVLYRSWAEQLWNQHLNGRLRNIPIPRLSEISAGNAGNSQAVMNQKFDLPPEKVLLDINIRKEILDELTKKHLDIYLAPLDINIFSNKREAYTPDQIRLLTNNENGHDVTSSNIINKHKDYYDWHVHEAFNKKPDEIYMPYGSGELFSNYLTWQRETWKNGIAEKDKRLLVSPEDAINIDIFAAEPRNVMHSIADKLTGEKPFIHYHENDIKGAKILGQTGKNTDACKFDDTPYLSQAHKIMNDARINTELSAAAGLALFLQRYETGKIDPSKKHLIINTGKGVNGYKK